MMISEKERLLIKKAKEGDEGSFETLILSCKGKAYNIALRYVKNENDAMDILQESFIKIFRHLDKFNEESKFETWVYRIVVNACNDFLRKNKNKYNQLSLLSKEDEEMEMDIPDSTPSPEELLLKKEHGAYILDCLEKIPIEHKKILILRDIKGFAYEDISEILDCSIGTVKSRISRARNNLKEVYLKNNIKE
ncbi:MAG: sigma-70 family RNA polymerase sigma factor [Clostridiales bacterium]|uniref:RNA polymerase sigma factor n=1 Tax=Aminipila sp. TaxID=2060095 RepID=UPI001DF2853B|nr:sigma-70 family RNA polymerase sigma factor [Aminipila sp.]MBE6033827.1 sigma-70 family RNA polymerase sigma factor [Clostridiales bacterium]